MSGKRQPQNPVIGHWNCEEGGRAVVRQATKRGHHFYTQCDCCGVNMGTGAKRQTKIWREAAFSPPEGVTVYKPNNVAEGAQQLPQPDAAQAEFEAVEPGSEPGSDPAGEAPAGAQAKRWRPGMASEGEAPAGDPAGESEPSGNRGALLALGVALVAIGAGAWMG